MTAPDLAEFYALNDLDPSFWALPWRPVQHRIRALLARPQSRLAIALTSPST